MDIYVSSEVYETADWPCITFPSAAVIGKAEELINAFYTSDPVEPGKLVFDFSTSVFIEIATLQLITSHIRRRHSLGYITKLRLPSGNKGLDVRHFLRRWRYAETFSEIFGKKNPFKAFVDTADHKYFFGSPTGGDPGDPYAGAMVRHEDRYGERAYRIETYRFFGFKTWLLSQDVDKRRFVEEEKKRWRNADPLIIETLNRRLKTPPAARSSTEHSSVNNEKLVMGRIVFQAITNALRHPRAAILQASSHMADRLTSAPTTPTGFTKTDNFFTLVYWDDGESMYATLRKALDANLPINHPTSLKATYLVDPGKPSDMDRQPRVVSSSEIPASGSSDKELLISTIFPGVTCDVKDSERLATVGLEEDDPVLALPGHGLFVLVQTAVELFGGSVAFRTGKFFMNVSALNEREWRQQNLPGSKPTYKIKTDQSAPAILGNMVTVRLPLGASGK